MVEEVHREDDVDTRHGGNSCPGDSREGAKMLDVFVQYLNRHGTDFSYIRSNPSFKDFSDTQLFNMYEEYINSKSTSVNKIGRESKIAKIERIIRCKEKDDLDTDEYSYRALALIEGRRQVQAVVGLRMDDFRLPFLLKDLELGLRQQLSYVEEIYGVLEKIGAIDPGFFDDCMHPGCDVENSSNMIDMAPKQETGCLPSMCEEAVPCSRVLVNDSGKALDIARAPEQIPTSSVLVCSLGSLDGVPGSNACEDDKDIAPMPSQTGPCEKAQPSSHIYSGSDKGMESMVDYPTSENTHIDSNIELCSGSDAVQESTARPAEGCLPRSMALKTNILSKYDDYLGDFNEDLLDMQLPVPKTSTYNPLEPHVKRIRANNESETSEHPDSPACNSTDNVEAQKGNTTKTRQSIQSMRKRNRSRVVVRQRIAPATPELLGTSSISAEKDSGAVPKEDSHI